MNSSFPAVVLMWFGMMAAMMLPVSLPWLRVLASLGEREDADTRARGVLFVAGYLAVWLGFSVAAAGVQLGTATRIPLAENAAAQGWFLFGAGLYQLSPLKAGCLRHCRNPLTWFLTRWRDGPRGALEMGWGHGLHCLGCCWALMALGLVAGMMHLAWMAVLALVVCIENLAPGGLVFARLAGAGLVVWGALAVWTQTG